MMGAPRPQAERRYEAPAPIDQTEVLMSKPVPKKKKKLEKEDRLPSLMMFD